MSTQMLDGQRTILEINHDLPIVHVQVVLRRGAAEDPLELDGLANFASELMARGAAERNRAQLDAAFDALGTSLDVIADLDAVHFEFSVLRSELEPALALLADVLLRPTFVLDEAEKLQRETAAQLDELREDDGQLARRYFQHALWGSHPYGRSILGTPETLERLSVDAARDWHQRMVLQGDLLFGLAGDIDEPTAIRALAEHFATLPNLSHPFAALPPPPRRKNRRLTLVDKPDRTQSQIFFGQPAPQWGSSTYYALQVATCAFGGTFSARLMNEVRSKRGLSYGASARLGQGRGRKALVEHVFPSLEQTPETLELVLNLHRDWVEKGISSDELNFAKSYLASSFAFGVATPEHRLELQIALAICGLPTDYAETFASRIDEVTLDAANRALRDEVTTEAMEVCIVSTAGALLPLLEAAGLTKQFADIEIVPFDSY